MKQLLIIYHSQSNRSQQLAFSCFQGALQESEIKVRCLRAIDVSSDEIIESDGLIFIFPENFAAISGGMKDLLDRVFYPLERSGVSAKPWCAIISAGNSGQSSLQQLEKILRGLNFRKVQETKIVYGDPGDEDAQAASELGLLLSTSLSMGIY